MEPRTDIVAPELSRPARSQDPKVLEFQKRLAHLDASFRSARRYEAHVGTFNEGLAILAHAVNPRAKRWAQKVRLHPVLEMAGKALWPRRLRDMGEEQDRAPAPEEMLDVCRELVEKLKPLRGRPTDFTLTYYVHALMALVQEASGSPATASVTSGSVYDPHMSSAGGRIVEMIFREADPSISPTTLANIVRQAHLSGAVDGKRFRDFFPFYGGRLDPERGTPVPGPGYRLERFEPAYPIYCS